MTKQNLIIILALFTAACGEEGASSFIDPELNLYYENFLADAEAHGLDLRHFPVSLEFGDESTPALKRGAFFNLGACVRGEGINQVIIMKPFFDTASDAGRQAVVYHELGHCLLGRGHTDTEIYSLMHPDALSMAQELSENPETLLEELFSYHPY